MKTEKESNYSLKNKNYYMENYKFEELSMKAKRYVLDCNREINIDKTGKWMIEEIQEAKNVLNGYGFKDVKVASTGVLNKVTDPKTYITFSRCQPKCINEDILDEMSIRIFCDGLNTIKLHDTLTYIADLSVSGNPTFTVSINNQESGSSYVSVVITNTLLDTTIFNKLEIVRKVLQRNIQNFIMSWQDRTQDCIERKYADLVSDLEVAKTIFHKFPNTRYTWDGSISKESDTFFFDELPIEAQQYVDDKFRDKWQYIHNNSVKLREIMTALFLQGFIKPKFGIRRFAVDFSYESIDREKAKAWIWSNGTPEESTKQMVHEINVSMEKRVREAYEKDCNIVNIANHYRIAHTKFDIDGNIIDYGDQVNVSEINKLNL